MRGRLGLAAACLVLGGVAHAAGMERAVAARWVGAWVLTGVEVRSDCAATHTDNRVNGALVQSRGARRFEPGELGRVVGIDAKDARVDVLVALAEPVLVGYADGPFTLLREAVCRVELEVVVPRETMRSKDVGAVDRALAGVLVRHATEREARDDAAWNGRLREEYPEDYAATLARHAAWQAEQVNAVIHAQVARAQQATARFADRFSSDPDYLAGFSGAIEDLRDAGQRGCTELVGLDLDAPGVPRRASAPDDEAERRFARGYADGSRLVLGLEMLERLPSCLVSVPALPGEDRGDGRHDHGRAPAS